MIWTEMALTARRRQPRDRDRTRVPRMTRRARADRAVGVRLADAVAVCAAARHRRWSLELYERMRRPSCVAGLKALGEVDLLSFESFGAEHGGPRHGGMAAMQKVLVDRLVTAAAVTGGQPGRNRKAPMLLPLL